MKKLLALCGVLAGGACALGAFTHNALINRNFEMPESVSKKLSESEADDLTDEKNEAMMWLDSAGVEKHEMVNDAGHRLRGYLIRPKKPSDVYVFGSHGYRSDGKGEWCIIAQHYVNVLGYNFFFVDHQAAGESEGKYIGFGSFESRDSLKWLRYMIDSFGEDIKIILHGISMGSATVMLMTGSEKLPENVKFTIADCGYTSALDEFNYKLESLGVPQKPIIPFVRAINNKIAGYDFGRDTNALEAVKSAKIPMLFIHGDDDKFVPTYMVYLLYDACASEYKDLFIAPGASHAESYHKAQAQYESKIAEFIERFI